MKKLLHSGWVALTMLLTLAGFARAAAPQLTFTGISADNKFGRYVPIVATLTVDGVAQQNFEVYYSTAGATPSKDDYVYGNEESTCFYRVIASGTTAEIMLTDATVDFKAIAYPAGSSTPSNLVQLNLTMLTVEKPAFDPPTPMFGAVEVDANTVIRIIDNAGGAEIFYSTDGATTPLKSAWEKNNPKVFKYDDATGITITQSMTIWAIAFKEINGQLGGSDILRSRFNLTKPTIKIALNPEVYTIGTEPPVVDLTIPEGVTLGTQPGNVAIQLTCPDNGFSQLITENSTPIDVSKAIAASREDEWTIRCSLVKGENPAQPFTGEIGLAPDVITMEILKNGERPAKPVFSVPDGKVYKGSKVAITCATPGAKIYYTTKDDEINVEYKQEITINQNVFIRAIAEKDGLSSYRDGVSTATYTVENDPVPELTVTVDPAAGSQISNAGTEITVTPSSTVDKIYFKLYEKADAVDKDENFNTTATEYSETVKPVPTATMPIVRLGLVKDGTWKYFSYLYTFATTPGVTPAPDRVAEPAFSRASGQVEKGTEITISCTTPDAAIHYTLNGEAPTGASELYSGPIEINATTTVKAIATKEGWENSTVASATYTVPGVPTPGLTLAFSPAGGSTVDAGTSVTIGSGGAKDVFYMMFASLKEARETEWDQDKASLYTAEMPPVLSVEQTTIKATYTLDGETLADTFFYATYTVRKAQSVELTFRPASGSAVEDSTEITVSAGTENAGIYYMVYADSMASVEEAPMFIMDAYMVSEDGNPVITQGNTFLKCGVYDNSVGGMKYFYASYTIKGPEEKIDTVEMPTFSPPSGQVEKGTKVAIACATEDARIYYTVNGDEPSLISLPYSDSIVIAESMTLKAIAFKAGMTKSKVAEATYTLKSVDNETEELAGVSVYPNPNNGRFHISVPVDAQADVITVGGQLVERVALTAGTHTLRVENSGVYFVRVRANGQVAIRKVFVR